MAENTPRTFNRRNMMLAAGASAGLAGLAGVTRAEAALLPDAPRTEEFDVVVIGSGMAGCAAALAAVSAGARAVVIEKASEGRMGGNSMLAGGSFAVPLGDDEASRQAYVEDYEKYCQGRGNSAIFRLMAQNGLADLAWLSDNGIALLEPEARPPNRIATIQAAPASFAGMPRLFRAIRSRIEALGGRFVFDTKAHQIIFDETGKAAGVRARARNGLVDYRGRSVVIAAGGYAGNTAMLEAYSDPNAGAMMVRGISWATGDGVIMAQQAGAGLKGLGGLMALHVAAVDGVETAAGQPGRLVPYSLSINREGNRFVDESLGYVNHGKAVLEQPGQMTSLVFDQAIREEAGEGVISTFTRLGRPVHQADTLDELARLIGVPVDTFTATVEAFNAAVEGETAPSATPPKAALARRIAQPPFYACSPLVPGITLTFGGIMVDDETRVLEADGRVIPGLFAAGENIGGTFFHDYIGGGALANALVTGRIAGTQAAA